MNAHYQTYSNLSSPHSPSPDDNGSYTTLSSHTTGNSNGTNNGIGGIGGGGGSVGSNGSSNGGGGGSNNIGNTSNNNNIINGNGINTNNNNNGCNIGLGNNTTNSNHMNGHGNNNNNNNNGISISSGSGINGNNIGIGNCNGINMVHHQNGNHEQQHMHMDNDQPDFHHLNNNNNNNNSNNHNSSIKSCAGCGGKILERYLLHALDRYWHNSCLKCYCCGALLADIGSSCYTKAGMILCKSDYTRMFATAPCSSCGQIIAANEFVMRTTIPISNNQNSNFHHQQQLQQQHHQSNQQMPILPENQKPFLGQMEHHVFHLKCFTCSKCSSQLRPGDRYYMLAGSLVCEPDWHKLLKNTTQSPPIRKGKVGRPRRTRD
ncbi:GATA zinc finger domain-containing protein 14-like [Condylostylus longicornis]|uniref:GATA zinc finger domain-containing protein 14-like n=1 Tax=Condylostylus longicornis TaxID=2530218 RepID=UPI00244DA069|nr:GATA zinc finger domain-containing protein 14-like [Condylostylus longicornis]